MINQVQTKLTSFRNEPGGVYGEKDGSWITTAEKENVSFLLRSEVLWETDWRGVANRIEEGFSRPKRAVRHDPTRMDAQRQSPFQCDSVTRDELVGRAGHGSVYVSKFSS